MFLSVFLKPLHPRSQEDPELTTLHLHRQRSHTENPVPGACIRSLVGTSVTPDLPLFISVLFLCYLNSLHLACPSFTSLYCLKFPPIFKIYLAQAPFPRSNLGWSKLGSSDNFGPCGKWRHWAHISEVLRKHQRKKMKSVRVFRKGPTG